MSALATHLALVVGPIESTRLGDGLTSYLWHTSTPAGWEWLLARGDNVVSHGWGVGSKRAAEDDIRTAFLNFVGANREAVCS